jgi:hypothetical protein
MYLMNVSDVEPMVRHSRSDSDDIILSKQSGGRTENEVVAVLIGGTPPSRMELPTSLSWLSTFSVIIEVRGSTWQLSQLRDQTLFAGAKYA